MHNSGSPLLVALDNPALEREGIGVSKVLHSEVGEVLVNGKHLNEKLDRVGCERPTCSEVAIDVESVGYVLDGGRVCALLDKYVLYTGREKCLEMRKTTIIFNRLFLIIIVAVMLLRINSLVNITSVVWFLLCWLCVIWWYGMCSSS